MVVFAPSEYDGSAFACAALAFAAAKALRRAKTYQHEITFQYTAGFGVRFGSTKAS